MHRLLLDAGKPQTAYSIGSEDRPQEELHATNGFYLLSSRGLIGPYSPTLMPARKYIKAFPELHTFNTAVVIAQHPLPWWHTEQSLHKVHL